MNMAHTKVKKVQEPSSVERGRRMRVTFARDMKVDESMATPLQERLLCFSSSASAAACPPSPAPLPLPTFCCHVATLLLRKTPLGTPLRPPPSRLSRVKCNKAATFTWTCELRLPLTQLPLQLPPSPLGRAIEWVAASKGQWKRAGCAATASVSATASAPARCIWLSHGRYF